MPNLLLVLHIAAGTVALVAGLVALLSAKGGWLHRRGGTLFVLAMLPMAGTGTVIAAARPEAITVIVGILTLYLVLTSVLTVRRPRCWAWRIDFAAMLVALTIGAAGIHFGFEAMGSPEGTRHGYPPGPYFMFGGVALLAGALDVRMLASRPLQPRHRLARHLWRMCFALYIATASFFLGQPEVIPEPVRHIAFLATPPLLVLLAMVYWLWRTIRTGVAGQAANPSQAARGRVRPGETT